MGGGDKTFALSAELSPLGYQYSPGEPGDSNDRMSFGFELAFSALTEKGWDNNATQEYVEEMHGFFLGYRPRLYPSVAPTGYRFARGVQSLEFGYRGGSGRQSLFSDDPKNPLGNYLHLYWKFGFYVDWAHSESIGEFKERVGLDVVKESDVRPIDRLQSGLLLATGVAFPIWENNQDAQLEFCLSGFVKMGLWSQAEGEATRWNVGAQVGAMASFIATWGTGLHQ